MTKRNPANYNTNDREGKFYLLSFVLHVILFVVLGLNFFNNIESASGPVQLELWAEGEEQVPLPPKDVAVDQKVTPEDTVVEPEPAPEPVLVPPIEQAQPEVPQPEPAVIPPLPKPDVVPEPEPQIDPQIALEEQKKKEEEEKRKAEEARKKAEEEKRKQEEARKKAEEEKRKAEDARLKAEEEKRKEEEARKKAEEERRKAEEARKKAEEERIAKEKAKRDAIRGDIMSRAGIKGGQNNTNQIGGGGGNSEYIRRVQACVQPHLKFNGPKKLKLNYKVVLGPNNKVQSSTVVVTSGNKAFDTAVLRAIYQCNPFPKPPKGNVIQGPYIYTPR